MNHKTGTTLLLLVILLIVSPLTAFGWGSVYHLAIGAKAETYLTPATREALARYLHGKSVSEVSTWLDWARNTQQYGYVDTWHSAEVDSTLHYSQAATEAARKAKSQGNPVIGVVEGLDFTTAALKDGKYAQLPDSTVEFYLKAIIHMVEDMHCPGHVKFNDEQLNHVVKYTFTVDGTVHEELMHAGYDRLMIQYIRPAAEYADFNIEYTDADLQRILTGTFEDWFNGNASYCQQLFFLTCSNPVLEGESWTRFSDKVRPVIDHQFTYAALRLANVLNMLFDPQSVKFQTGI